MMLRLLVIDDDPGDVRLLTRNLDATLDQECSIVCAASLAEACEHLRTREVDLVLLDLGLPDSQGLDTIDKVCQEFSTLPIVVLTGLDSEEAGLESLRRGASDYLIKGKYNADQLLRTIRYSLERKRLEQQLVRLALHDPLTGVLNRRAFNEALARRVARAQRGELGAILMFDIDHFKQVNDNLGHDAGDELLVRIVELARNELRESDELARLGGDEFVVLLHTGDLSHACAIGERLRKAVADLPLDSHAGVHPTLSIGVVLIDGSLSPEDVLTCTDGCMYRAKIKGRNQLFAA